MEVTSWKLVFQNINLRVTSWNMQVTSRLFTKIKLQAASYELGFNKQNARIAKLKVRVSN